MPHTNNGNLRLEGRPATAKKEHQRRKFSFFMSIVCHKTTRTILTFISALFTCVLFSCNSKRSKYTLFNLPGHKYLNDSNINKLKQKFEQGYIEYFSINETSFRLLKNPKLDARYDLQASRNDQWVTNLTLTMPEYTFDLKHDFDFDGYYDLSFLEYGHIKIYPFNKINKQFNLDPIQFSYDYALLDSTKAIYGANDKRMDWWDIDIFSIKSHSKFYLYKAKIFVSYNIGLAIKNAVIYKCRNGSNIDTVMVANLKINRQFGDFSLLHFMKDLAHNHYNEQ